MTLTASERAAGLEPPTARRRQRWPRCFADDRLLVTVLFVAALGLRLWHIGDRGFWLDELSAVGTSALSFSDLRLALTVEANMTLYYWALFSWLRVVGTDASEALIRLPSAVIGALTVPLIYLLGRRLHTRQAGLAAAALLAVNSFHVLMSQEARAYSLLAGLTVGSFLLLDRALGRGRRRDWALHGVISALAFYCHFYTAFTMLAQSLFVLTRRSRAALLGLLGSGLVMFGLAAQLMPFFIRQRGGSKLSHLLPPDWSDAAGFLEGFTGGSVWTLALYAGLVLVGLLLARPGARRPAYRNALLLLWFGLPVGLAFGISLVKPIFNDRYLFATLPALPLLAGVGLARLPRWAGLAAFVLVAGSSLAALQGDFGVRRIEQWREAVSYVRASAQPGDGWIFVSKWGQNGLEYYGGWRWGADPNAPYADVFEPFDWREAFKVAKYREVLAIENLPVFASGHARIWLILSHEFDAVLGGDTAAPVRDWLTRHGYAAQQRQYRGVRVLLYTQRGAAP